MCAKPRLTLSTSSPASKNQNLSPAQLTHKLQQSLGGPKAQALLENLAKLLTEHAFEARGVELYNMELGVSLVQKTLQAWLCSEAAISKIECWVEEVFNQWNGDARPLEALLSAKLKQGLLALSLRPFSPSPVLLKSLLGTPPVRELIRKALARALGDFARRATASMAPAPVAQVAQGVGQWAKLAARTALSKAGALGEMVGAMSNEVERQAEKRAAEFVDAALEKTIEDLAQAFSNPSHNSEAVALRHALLETALGWRLPQLAREIANADLPGAARSLQSALSEWVASEEFGAKLLGGIGFLRKESTSWKGILERHGLLSTWFEAAQQQTLRQLQALVQTPAFGLWLGLWVESALEVL
ncbi:MAG: hypothetical protein FWG75_10820 [Cystobacterineae bacterium]|nr:hypothetical protein [Cystobacterineae bacterium]